MKERFCQCFLTPAAAMLILALAAWAIYSNALGNPFVFDDRTVIEKNTNLRHPGHWPGFFRGEIDSEHRFNGGYRPLPMLTLALNYHTNPFLGSSHLDPYFYRLFNLFLHLLNAWLLFFLAARLLCAGRECPLPQLSTTWFWAVPPLLVALYYLGHPVQTQSINFIWKRTGLLSATWILAGTLAYASFIQEGRRRSYWLAHLWLIAGFLTKEDSLVTPLLFALLTWILTPQLPRSWRYRALALVPSFVMAAIFYYLLLPRLVLPYQGQILGLMERGDYLRTQVQVIYRYLGLCFLPYPLNIDHQVFPAMSRSGRWLEMAGAVGLLALAGGAILIARRRPAMAFGALAFFALLLPTSLVPLTVTMDEHRLLLPLGFFAVFLVSLVLWLFQQILFFRCWPQATLLAGYLFFCLIAGANAVGARYRNPLWRSEKFLWEESLQQNPNNVRAYANLSFLANQRGDFLEGRAMALEAIRRNPYYHVSYLNLGIAYAKLKEEQAARRAFHIALQIKPDYINGMYNLAWLEFETGHYDEMRRLGEQILALQPGHPLGLEILNAVPAGEKGRPAQRISRGEALTTSPACSAPDSPELFPEDK